MLGLCQIFAEMGVELGIYTSQIFCPQCLSEIPVGNSQLLAYLLSYGSVTLQRSSRSPVSSATFLCFKKNL